MVKSAAQIKKQLSFWYLRYHEKKIEQVTGLEAFTVFDLVPPAAKELLPQKVALNAFALPVLLTRVEPGRMPFGLRLTNQETVYWSMPTGAPMYGFWNVTKHCELIGGKYEIAEHTQ